MPSAVASCLHQSVPGGESAEKSAFGQAYLWKLPGVAQVPDVVPEQDDFVAYFPCWSGRVHGTF